MRTGQYVTTLDGTRWQVVNWTSGGTTWAGMGRTTGVITLADPLTGIRCDVTDTNGQVVNTPAGRAVYVPLTLTPACESCGVPAGVCYGEGLHYATPRRQAPGNGSRWTA